MTVTRIADLVILQCKCSAGRLAGHAVLTAIYELSTIISCIVLQLSLSTLVVFLLGNYLFLPKDRIVYVHNFNIMRFQK